MAGQDDDDGHRTELYIAFGIYLGLLLVVGVCAKVANMRELRLAAGHGDDMTQHFLAGKSTPTILLVLTTFSTIFSGYTVVGVPQEAASAGFFAVRWVGVTIAITISMLVIAPRLRALAEWRGYSSPSDFIADRYRSEMLRLMVISSLFMGNLMYTVVQFVSLDDVIEVVTNGRISGKNAVIFLAAFILLLESLGGLKSVMLTDAIQSTLMIGCFIVVPIILTMAYGGFVGTLRTRDCTGSIDVCGIDAKPTLFYYPKMRQATAFASYVGAFASYAILPQMVQRIFTAGQAKSVRLIVTLLPICAFLCMIPGIYLGILRATSFPEEDGTAFGVISSVLYDRGGFHRAMGIILMCSGVAAIMSTADSAIIACSQLLAEDVFKKRVAPDASTTATLVASKLSSLAVCVVAVLWSRDDEFDLGYCANLQLGFQLGAFPVYFFGLYPSVVRWFTGDAYKSPSSRSMIVGWMLGTAVFIVLVVKSRANERVTIWLEPGVWGLAANLAAIVFVETFGPPAWLDDFDRAYDVPPAEAMSYQHARGAVGMKGLTDKLLARCVTRITGDPLVGVKPMCACAFVFLLMIVPSPWWQQAGKHTRDDHSSGWPDWALAYLACQVVAAVVLMYMGWRWQPGETALHWTPSKGNLSTSNFPKTLAQASKQNLMDGVSTDDRIESAEFINGKSEESKLSDPG